MGTATPSTVACQPSRYWSASRRNPRLGASTSMASDSGSSPAKLTVPPPAPPSRGGRGRGSAPGERQPAKHDVALGDHLDARPPERARQCADVFVHAHVAVLV